jgi:hypothetical protein
MRLDLRSGFVSGVMVAAGETSAKGLYSQLDRLLGLDLGTILLLFLNLWRPPNLILLTKEGSALLGHSLEVDPASVPSSSSLQVPRWPCGPGVCTAHNSIGQDRSRLRDPYRPCAAIHCTHHTGSSHLALFCIVPADTANPFGLLPSWRAFLWHRILALRYHNHVWL